jgi:tetratricopeptide (TPR) repeat protein
MQFKGSKEAVPSIAKTLGVDAIVEGSVIRDGNRIRVHAQLIRAAIDEHFWSETYDRELKDVLALESEVAQSIAEKVEVTATGQEHQRLANSRPVSPEVYENYLKGTFALDHSNSRADTERSLQYFETAIRLDPTFAPAYLGLAGGYQDLGTIFTGVRPKDVRPKEMSAIRKALELDPESVDAHVTLGEIDRVQWRWAESESEYRRAIELNPSSAIAQLGLAQWLLCQGRTEEALARAQHARELDPLLPGGQIAWILFQSHRYDEATRELRSVLAVTPDDTGALWYLGYALFANGHPEQAIPPLEKAVSMSNRSPGVIGVLIRAYAHAGRRSDALRLLAELKKRQEMGYMPAGAFISAYLGLGDNEQAFVWLEKGYQEQSNILMFLKVHPHFDPIRNDPRFSDLLRRVGLDQAR